jgi:hypothetical protein
MTPQIATLRSESAAVRRTRSLRCVVTPSFLDCVATVAAEERQRARERGEDAELIDIAYWSRASQGAVSRFENHHSQPRELDRLLAAYAKVCDVPAAAILREAVERWEGAGGGTIEPVRSERPDVTEEEERGVQAAEEEARNTLALRPATGRGGRAKRRGTPDS